MYDVLLALLIGLAVLSCGMALVGIALGPTHADRVVALDILLAAAVALAVGAFLQSGRTAFLDVAIGLALVGFVATLGWARLLDRTAPLRAAPAPRGRSREEQR